MLLLTRSEFENAASVLGIKPATLRQWRPCRATRTCEMAFLVYFRAILPDRRRAGRPDLHAASGRDMPRRPGREVYQMTTEAITFSSPVSIDVKGGKIVFSWSNGSKTSRPRPACE